MFIENFTYVANLIGVIAFAASGVIKGLKHKLDILGVVVLAVMTAVGGGIIRDVLVNKIPNVLIHTQDIVVAIITAILLFIIMKRYKKSGKSFYKELLVMDAIGLAIFTIIGAKIAINAGFSIITVAIFATITGVGGGVIRDIFVAEIPIILKEDIYAFLCFFGAILYYYLPRIFISDIVVFAIILIVRLIIIKYKINLPK
ncbi:trimeric intracellular cation channel family protein [Sneathia sanguinegens]|jgi:hypothetical protein|uniref:Trimeric intracellular cation channel family protein n=1 Tax=Sneathia sanguinegens TaxID=40543 RepID=A0ABT7HHK8_9FUSO|nr:trimeric intracellular cation channel family protein [Sneathia sanguinegens]MDK9579997.1 trimeric intracellular cation channel family protein [Sneathia sanguinegens]MDU4652111.1 trimeric intracellular cation channel family protein [Sneathia sanguinegens]MDU7496922.1 trimeric intracellular cation channel family protein [Sneathia sanguinegens]